MTAKSGMGLSFCVKTVLKGLLFAVLLLLISAVDGKLVFSYYNRYDGGVKVSELNCKEFTHLIWSFANILKDGTVTLEKPEGSLVENVRYATQEAMSGLNKCSCSGTCLRGELGELLELRRKCPHIKTILSVGGWVWSSNFSPAFETDVTIGRAISSSINLMNTYAFDGLDIDWEFPGMARTDKGYFSHPDDIKRLMNFTLAASSAFKAHPKKFLLTIAMRAFRPESEKNWATIGKAVDYGFLMGYEYQHNNLRTRPGAALDAPAYFNAEEKNATIESGFQSFIDGGFPAEKMLLGIPLYYIGWEGDMSSTTKDPKYDDGLSSYTGASIVIDGQNVLTPLKEKVPYFKVFEYAKANTMTEIYSVPWTASVFYSAKGIISGESPKSIKSKVEFVKLKKMAGLMLWNVAQDVKGANSISTSIFSELGSDFTNPATKVSFCDDKSSFCNLRCNYKNTATVGDSGSAPGGVVGDIQESSSVSLATIFSSYPWFSAIMFVSFYFLCTNF